MATRMGGAIFFGLGTNGFILAPITPERSTQAVAPKIIQAPGLVEVLSRPRAPLSHSAEPKVFCLPVKWVGLLFHPPK